jgi:hypothetical protein
LGGNASINILFSLVSLQFGCSRVTGVMYLMEALNWMTIGNNFRYDCDVTIVEQFMIILLVWE